MPHHTLADAWRVPLLIVEKGTVYEIYISENAVLRYDKKTLPKSVRTKLSMIYAMPEVTHLPDSVYGLGTSIYLNTHDPRLEEIGWRCAVDAFIVVLDKQEFLRLRGKLFLLKGNVYDARNKSEENGD